MENDGEPLVVDVGSSTIKAGFAGEDAPRVIFPSVVGQYRFEGLEEQGESYVGDEALSRRNDLSMRLTYPVERGIITNWEAIEKACNS